MNHILWWRSEHKDLASVAAGPHVWCKRNCFLDKMRIALVTNWKSCSRKYNFTLWTNPVCENGLQPKWGLGGNLKICFRKYNFTFWTNPTVENGLQPKWGLGGNLKSCFRKYNFTFWTNPTVENGLQPKWGLGGWHVGSSSWATVIVGDFFVADMAFWDMYEVNLSQYVAAAMEFSSRIGHCFQISHFLGHWKPNWHSWQLGNLTTYHQLHKSQLLLRNTKLHITDTRLFQISFVSRNTSAFVNISRSLGVWNWAGCSLMKVILAIVAPV